MPEATDGKLSELDGFIGACLVDSEAQVVLTSEGSAPSFDLEAESTRTAEIAAAKLSVLQGMGLTAAVEDILITQGEQCHLLRPLQSDPSVFIYVALDKARADLAFARMKLKSAEGNLSP